MKKSWIKRGQGFKPRKAWGITTKATKKRVVRRIRATKPKHVAITKLKKKLWELCKAITRKEYGNTCYTCGRTGLEGGNWQTGHFIPSSICSVGMRYSLDNLRPQCYRCNIHLSGNWIAFENRLLSQFGELYVKALKRENEETKGKQYDSLWYTAKIAEYEALLLSTPPSK